MYIPAVYLDGPLRDGKAEARTARVTRPGIVDPIKAVENFRGMFRRYPGTVIEDVKEDLSPRPAADLDANLPARG